MDNKLSYVARKMQAFQEVLDVHTSAHARNIHFLANMYRRTNILLQERGIKEVEPVAELDRRFRKGGGIIPFKSFKFAVEWLSDKKNSKDLGDFLQRRKPEFSPVKSASWLLHSMLPDELLAVSRFRTQG